MYCARLVSAVSVMAKLRLCEKAFAPADAVTPSIPASRSGQHQLPTARAPHAFFGCLVKDSKQQAIHANVHQRHLTSPLQQTLKRPSITTNTTFVFR